MAVIAASLQKAAGWRFTCSYTEGSFLHWIYSSWWAGFVAFLKIIAMGMNPSSIPERKVFTHLSVCTGMHRYKQIGYKLDAFMTVHWKCCIYGIKTAAQMLHCENNTSQCIVSLSSPGEKTTVVVVLPPCSSPRPAPRPSFTLLLPL